jgi:hypothetical protein
MKKLATVLRTIFGLLLIGMLLIALLGPAILVEVSNLVAPGEIVAKREEVTLRRSSWSRHLLLDVRYTPASGNAEQTTISVDAPRFDTATIGDSVEVRYLPWPELRLFGSLAAPRLEDQGPFGQLQAIFGDGFWLVAGIGLWSMLLFIWSRWRTPWLTAILTITLLGGATYLVVDLPPPPPAAPQQQALATIQETHDVTKFLRRGQRNSPDLPQPYVIVELTFTPTGTNSPVVAVDQIDAGSLAGLSPGATFPVTYNATNPRQAHLDNAQRTYYWKNLALFAPVPILLLLLIGGAFWYRQRQQAQRRQRATP